MKFIRKTRLQMELTRMDFIFLYLCIHLHVFADKFEMHMCITRFYIQIHRHKSAVKRQRKYLTAFKYENLYTWNCDKDINDDASKVVKFRIFMLAVSRSVKHSRKKNITSSIIPGLLLGARLLCV